MRMQHVDASFPRKITRTKFLLQGAYRITRERIDLRPSKTQKSFYQSTSIKTYPSLRNQPPKAGLVGQMPNSRVQVTTSSRRSSTNHNYEPKLCTPKDGLMGNIILYNNFKTVPSLRSTALKTIFSNKPGASRKTQTHTHRWKPVHALEKMHL